MSKYTTEVRFICESKSGLEESKGASSVDEVIANSWSKIFTSKVSFFDEAYRSVLCQKILKHYYLREIGAETVGIWMLWMNTRLEEIMPYYNQLYESAKIEFDPMHDVNLTRKHERNVDGTSKEDGTRTDNTTGNRTLTGGRDTDSTGSSTRNTTSGSDETKRDLYSDTPQGAITGLENENYLTNARKITNNVNGTGTEETNTTENTGTNYSETEYTTGKVDGITSNTGSSSTTEDYLETITGKQGTESFSSLLNKFRETFLNIDMQVIEEFSDLFFGLW